MTRIMHLLHTVSDGITTTGDVIATCVVLVYVNTARQTDNCHVTTARDHPTILCKIKPTRRGTALTVKEWSSLQ